jgi:hypothetical protein
MKLKKGSIGREEERENRGRQCGDGQGGNRLSTLLSLAYEFMGRRTGYGATLGRGGFWGSRGKAGWQRHGYREGSPSVRMQEVDGIRNTIGTYPAAEVH